MELFTDYGASVKIVYLETDMREQIRKNENRSDSVPTQVISRMMEKLVPPEAWEAHWVEMAMCLETSGSSEDENEKME